MYVQLHPEFNRSWRIHLTHKSSPCAVYVIGHHNSCTLFITKQKTHKTSKPTTIQTYKIWKTPPLPKKKQTKPHKTLIPTQFWVQRNLPKWMGWCSKILLKIPNYCNYFSRVEMYITLLKRIKKSRDSESHTHTQKLHPPTKKPSVYQEKRPKVWRGSCIYPLPCPLWSSTICWLGKR